MAPVWPFRLVTPTPAPPVQEAKLRTPLPSLIRQSPTEPSFVGSVSVTLGEVTPLWIVRVLPLVELLNTILPLLVLARPRLRPDDPCKTAEPATVMTVLLSLIIELTSELVPLNLGMVPAVPPDEVTPPPAPTQLPTVVQIV